MDIYKSSIWCDSELGKDTTFTLTIAQHRAEKVIMSYIAEVTILLVEHDPGYARLIGNYLRRTNV